MSAQHTPGPWRVNESDNVFGELRALQIVKGRREIAEVMLIDQPASQVANARLMAAAPELLAAVRRLLPKPFTGNPSDKELIEFWRTERGLGRGEADDVLAAYAAIAKATGAKP